MVVAFFLVWALVAVVLLALWNLAKHYYRRRPY